MPAGTSRWFGNKAAVRSTDGRLWFVAGRGVTVADPKALGAERPSDDTVRLEGALVDGRPLSAASTAVLPSAAVRVQIDYTVLYSSHVAAEAPLPVPARRIRP